MDAGQVGEYGSPKELLRNPKSLFAQLVAAEQQQEREGGFKNVGKNNEESSSDSVTNDGDDSGRVNDGQKGNLELMNDSSLIDSADSDSKKSVKSAR